MDQSEQEQPMGRVIRMPVGYEEVSPPKDHRSCPSFALQLHMLRELRRNGTKFYCPSCGRQLYFKI